MNITPQVFGLLVKMTITDPKGAARIVMHLPVPRTVWWIVIALTTVLSALISGVLAQVMPAPPVTVVDQQGSVMMALEPLPPLVSALFLFSMAVVLTFAITYVGQSLGGSGKLRRAVALVAWLQIMTLLLQLAQLVGLILPGIVLLAIVFAAIVIFFRTLAYFIKELHGFNGMGRAVATIFASFIGIAVGMIVIMALIGAGASGGAT